MLRPVSINNRIAGRGHIRLRMGGVIALAAPCVALAVASLLISNGVAAASFARSLHQHRALIVKIISSGGINIAHLFAHLAPPLRHRAAASRITRNIVARSSRCLCALINESKYNIRQVVWLDAARKSGIGEKASNKQRKINVMVTSGGGIGA